MHDILPGKPGILLGKKRTIIQFEEIFLMWCYYKQIGSAINVDVIKFDPVSMEVIIRVKERYVIGAAVYYTNPGRALP